ncbi:LysM peptidoglycan-binding domain-containing protein [Radiobacillus sp. PE A8.2]|uniref:LysM peptidoglycan-binding domain-containing protein n=1 Tax=Radiobacillus sp. PE A8.2 TaxID=3380349 RepID=UPI00388FF5C3
MEPFTHYKLNETAHGVEIILYLDESLTEFSDELGTTSKMGESNINKEAVSFVKRMFPSLKVKTVKIMAGAMLLTSFGVGTLSAKHAEASPAPSLYTVSAGDTLSEIAEQRGTTVEVIKQANQLSSDVIYVGQALNVPASGSLAPHQKNATSYIVVPGDTLSEIAEQSGTTVEAIKQTNQLSSDVIYVGQALNVPGSGSSFPIQTNATSYTVVSGDTLSEIAEQNGTTVDAIKQSNQLSSDVIYVGQALNVPASGTSAPASTNGSSYIVVSGDTLSEIAARNGTTVDAIKQTNQLSSDFLQIGQALTIPTATSLTSPLTEAKQQAKVNQEEVEWLAKMIFSEGRGETLEGQIAVGAVIMNRVESPLFANNIKDVLFEKSNGYFQFTPAATGAIHAATPSVENIDAATRAINGEDPTNGALFFYNPDKTSSPYLLDRTVSTVIGNHTFAY